MVKRLFIILLLFFTASPMVFSQTYGNEWISYNQKYYTFPIVNSGIYKLDYTTLLTAGIPISTFTSQNIQLFGREKEIPLHIVDGGDSSLDSGDYILFYAERNDSWLDSTLYLDPNTVGNPSYSLVNDTINYFFTWNNLSTNLRYSVETSVDFPSYTPSNFILQKVESSYGTFYNLGGIPTTNPGVLPNQREHHSSTSFYASGEGFGLSAYNGVATGGYTSGFNVVTNSPYVGVDAPLVKFKGISSSHSEADAPNGGPNHHVKWEIGASDFVLWDELYTGYDVVFANQYFSSSVLSSGITSLKWSIVNDLSIASDFQSLNYWSLIYPKQPTLDGTYSGKFNVKNNSIQSKIRLDFTNTLVSNPIVFVTGSTPIKANLTSFNGGYSMLFNNSANNVDQQVVIQDFSSVSSISIVKPVNSFSLSPGFFTDFSLIDVDSALLMIYHQSLILSTKEYETYRKSIAGGAYKTVMANIDELYLQFGGGISKHINSIRRFTHYMYNLSIVKPVGLFLVGKSVSLADSGWPYGSAGSRTNTASYAMNLIPTFGEPASDIAITSYLEGNKWIPLIPVGRASVRTDQELFDYLVKVKEFELKQDPNSVYNSEEKDWQKHILHFGGGVNSGQQQTFKGYLDAMKSIIEDSLYGGEVTGYFKTSSSPINPGILTDVNERIADGISLMTFFGHASPSIGSGFDINIDVPSTWNNEGKYPVIIGNSCWVGNMYVNTATQSVSERFVNIPLKGAVAFIGASADALDSPTARFTEELYAQFSYYGYGKTLSEQIKNSVNSLEISSFSSLMHEAAAMQMNLLGDPMLRLNWHDKPEIELTVDKVSFTPENLDLTLDSIGITIVLKNLGKAIVDTFNVEITRDFPLLNIDSVYNFKISRLDYIDTFYYKMPLQPNIGVGINNITVAVDIPSILPEQYDEIGNNRVTTTLFVDVDGILPVIPHDFAVVPIDSVTVIGSTINPLAEYKTYRFEIDTTDLFNSPECRYALKSGLGGVKSVNPSEWKLVSNNQISRLTCTDSTVYFWRVAIDSSVFDWRERSFQYIIGKKGWGQDHFFQFKKNDFLNVNYNRNSREREFIDNPPDTLRSFIHSFPGTCASFINAQKLENTYCILSPVIHVDVIDPITHVPWMTRYVPTGENLNNDFGNSNDNGACNARSMKDFTFNSNSPDALDSLQIMLLDVIPDGYFVVIYTTMGANYSDWTPSMFATFHDSLGCDSIFPGRANLAFSIFFKKGDPSSIIQRFAYSNTDVIDYSVPLENSSLVGLETSTLIGPAGNWGNLYWKQDALESPTEDSTALKIKVFDVNQSFQFDIDTLFTSNDSILNLNSIVDANLYPYIKLEALYTDSTFMFPSPANIDRWHILYNALPEAAIDGSSGYSWIPSKDTLDEGESVKFAIDIRNIYDIDMDSLLVKYWIEDNSHYLHPLTYLRQDSLKVNEVFRDTIEFSTIDYVGVNSLWMEVNPYVNGSLVVTDQPEQEHFNNLLQVPFRVTGDNINPILDVTFNGRHILNKDIIAPKSEIFITLKDENPLIIMDSVSDTTQFGVYLTGPDGIQKRIPFVDGAGNVIMQWVPADAQNKRFKIIYPGSFQVDGIYTLLVQGTDRSGNISGDIQYKISFEIIKESTITYLMNYPNPFSTSTRFVFTLTGSEVPQDMIIQIMTVTGKVVREITEDELGPIYIGRNITEFDWNGTDEFGDPLANGVYLYRVKSRLNNEEIKHRDSGADTHFTKDFGKMYIMR